MDSADCRVHIHAQGLGTRNTMRTGTMEAMEGAKQEQNMEREITFPDPCVYCGPSVKGVAKQYTVYTGGNVPGPLRDLWNLRRRSGRCLRWTRRILR